MNTKEYVVEVIVEYKPTASDPAGETIERDLMHKNGYEMVSNVRTGNYMRMKIRAKSPDDARAIAERLCNELRIFNPVAHKLTIRVGE